MELQNQLNEDSSRYFCHEEHTNEGNSILVDKCSPLRMDANSNPFCNHWMHSCSGSYAMDARIRLETLKSGSSSPVPNGSMDGSMYSYDYSKDIWEIGLKERSALDTVDLIDVERVEENEESWLYVSPTGVAFVETTEPALKWCRHVLDNRSPAMEAACRRLINRLNLKLSHESRHLDLQQTGSFSSDSSVEQMFTSTNSSYDDSNHDLSADTNYRLHNITDVYHKARIQEASAYRINRLLCELHEREHVVCVVGLRQEYVHTPRGLELPIKLPPYNNIHGNRTRTSSCQSSVSAGANTEKNSLSPKVTRLHQYKMLKRAQSQGSSSRSSSPLRTSLRSLQAVRSSRSLDIDDFDLDQIFHPTPGISPAKTSSTCKFSSHLTCLLDSNVPAQSKVIKRCQRSHSLSPCRIPQPPLSSPDRVTASPQNSRAAAWSRSGRQMQR